MYQTAGIVASEVKPDLFLLCTSAFAPLSRHTDHKPASIQQFPAVPVLSG